MYLFSYKNFEPIEMRRDLLRLRRFLDHFKALGEIYRMVTSDFEKSNT